MSDSGIRLPNTLIAVRGRRIVVGGTAIPGGGMKDACASASPAICTNWRLCVPSCDRDSGPWWALMTGAASETQG